MYVCLLVVGEGISMPSSRICVLKMVGISLCCEPVGVNSLSFEFASI